MTPFRSPLLFAFLWLCLLVPSSASMARGSDDDIYLPFVPHPEAEDAAPLSGSTWVEMGPGFTLRLQQIDEAERLAYIEKVTGFAIDPFAAPEDQQPRFESFLLQIENVGAARLMFRSQQCLLKGGNAEILHPLAMEVMQTEYRMMGQEMQPAYQRVGPALIPTSRELRIGDSIAGLLIYPKVKPRTKQFNVEIQITTSAGDVVTINAPYRRLKKKEVLRKSSGKP